MFKKPIQLGHANKLSGSDRKKFKASVVKSFGVGPEAEEALSDLVPNKQGDFTEASYGIVL